MSVERAKEFLVELAENDEAADKVDAAYLSAMSQVAADLGYDLSDEELVSAIVEMSGLGDTDVAEVTGFQIWDSFAPWSVSTPRMFGNPLNFRPRFFGS